MELQLSERVQGIKPSPTLAVTARANEMRAAGHDIIGLGAGEPDFDTPDHIKDAARRAMDEGFTKYTAVDGIAPLKEAIRNKFARDNGLDYAMNEVIVSCGGKQCYYNLAQAMLNPGDEVIIPAPYWVSYPDMSLLAGAKPVIVEAGIEQQFKITPDQLAAAITDRTRLVVVNSPSNPTGVCYSSEELRALGEVLLAHPHVAVTTDDIYEHIIWGDEPFANIVMACPELKDRAIVLNGVSKAYSMTGWRIGYAAGPANIIGAMKKIQSQSTSNPTSIAQVAAQEALEGDQSFIGVMVKAFKERHDYVVETLNAMPGVECLSSQGAFYAFAKMQEVLDGMDGIDDDVALAEHFIAEAGVAMVPGSAFGAPGYMRLSFATGMDNLKEALDRVAKLIGG